MTTIHYTSKINSSSTDIRICDANKYQKIINTDECKCGGGYYECLPDDVPIKAYYDFDWKHEIIDEEDADIYTKEFCDFKSNETINSLQIHLTDYWTSLHDITPKFSISTLVCTTLVYSNLLCSALL